jgi:zinc transport system ATP-binding protein
MFPNIKISNLSFSYENTPILTNVNLTLPKNQFYGIIGPNGGGKTTFIKLLMGLLTPTKGKISLFGLSHTTLRKKIGYVPQTSLIDRDFPIRVLELVLLGALSQTNFLGQYPITVKEKALNLLKALDLYSLREAPFQELSLGQMQKVFFARSLISDPLILILDEPTASVDIQSEKKIFSLLKSIKHTKTIFIVSHDLNTMANEVDQILYVHKTIELKQPNEICGHFSLGLYHENSLKD